MSRNGNEERDRGYRDGAKPQSASEVGAAIIAAPILSEDYRDGFKDGQKDYADGKA